MIFQNKVCADCGHYYYGQSYKPCPNCSDREDGEDEMNLQLGVDYKVEEQVSFDQYVYQKGTVLQFNHDSRGRLVGNRVDFRFHAVEQRVVDMIKTGKLKLVSVISSIDNESWFNYTWKVVNYICKKEEDGW